MHLVFHIVFDRLNWAIKTSKDDISLFLTGFPFKAFSIASLYDHFSVDVRLNRVEMYAFSSKCTSVNATHLTGAWLLFLLTIQREIQYVLIQHAFYFWVTHLLAIIPSLLVAPPSIDLHHSNVPFHFFNYVIFCPLIIWQIFSDVACHRKILDAKVRCPNRDCTWTGELRDVGVRIDHFTLQFFAPFQPSTLFNLYCNQINTSLWRLRHISHKLYARICTNSHWLDIFQPEDLIVSIAVLLRITLNLGFWWDF